MSKSKAGTAPLIRLDAFLPYQLSVLANRLARQIGKIAADHSGLNLTQWRVLAAIAEQPGRTARQVVAVTPMDKGLVSRAVRRLADSGLLRREASDTDGRLAHLHLTPRGQATYEALATRIAPIEQRLLAGFAAPDRARIGELVSHLLRATEATNQDPQGSS